MRKQDTMTLRMRMVLFGASVLALGLYGTLPVTAQQAPWATDAPKAQPKASGKSGGGQAAPKAAAPKDDASPAKSGDGALRQRVEQLEEQLADMQVTIGTLESLGKGGGGASRPAGNAPGGGGGVDQARIDSLETQIRALTAQVEQLSGQVRQAGRRADAPVPDVPPRADAVATPSSGFGSLTVKPGAPPPDRDPIGRVLNETAATPASAQPLPPGAANAGNPKELYETAYGYLLQQDYGAAEVAFEEFLRRYPSDRQTADAQYWYGETLYVQRRYKPAGQAFLRVIERHQASAKVPNSLLKLAMSLEQLGQKDCSLYSELETKHPNAPADVKTRARAMKQRQGC